ncbi:hypothetical protein NV379_05775 [Paenibacillus sp. N1-5-1-14]|uniref:DUF6115 domain-containing protein n=1 Tax=Paenibacillus radicibacter TaxID=2972488 RepID=UPI0021593837|nr:hypothetical protein [Paenibacillus radicibacter]MCR8642163.1 hypothetical protein [Paenibacillus radicibacter]
MDHPMYYVILLGLVIVVFTQFFMRKDSKKSKASGSMDEFEKSVGMFAAELEEQNEALVKLFADSKRESDLKLAHLAGKLELMEKHNHELAQELSHLKLVLNERRFEASIAPTIVMESQRQVVASVEVVPESIPEPEADPLIKARYPDIFELYEQGKSVEYIAKKLGKNKGEVNLILMLSRQEEAAR